MQRGEARLAHRSSALQQQTEAMLARIQEQGHAGAVGVQVLTAGPPGPLLPPPRVLHGASQCLQLSERATDRTWAWLHSSVPDPPLGARAATPLQVLTPLPSCRLLPACRPRRASCARSSPMPPARTASCSSGSSARAARARRRRRSFPRCSRAAAVAACAAAGAPRRRRVAPRRRRGRTRAAATTRRSARARPRRRRPSHRRRATRETARARHARRATVATAATVTTDDGAASGERWPRGVDMHPSWAHDEYVRG